MIKAVFFDIDGTLVSFRTHKVTKQVKNALYALRENGIKIFIATGRSRNGLAVIEDIPFDGYITLNGQYCYTQDQLIYKNTIQKEDLETLIAEEQISPFPIGFTMENHKIYNFKNEDVAAIHAITHNDDQPCGDVTNITEEEILQCMCFVDEEKEKELLEKMPHCTSARWHPLFTDISPFGGSKQKGIDLFLDFYHIDLSETLSFGDGGNDIPMLKHTAHSAAMGNATEHVKEIAEYICDDVDHDGILDGLRHFHLL